MAGFTDSTQIAESLRLVYQDSFVDAIYRNNQFLNLSVNGQALFPKLPAGDTSYRWNVAKSAGGGAAIFTEGGIAPAPTAMAYANAAVSYTYMWSWVRISGHVRDLARNGALQRGVNVVDNEFVGAQADIVDLMNTSFMGSTYGLEVAIDSGTTYAGIARGSASYWESTETNNNGALTRAALMNIHETCRDNDKAGRTAVILAPENQITNYIALTGEPNAQNSSFRFESTLSGGKIDLAPMPTMASFMGIPIIGVYDMTDTVIMGLDLRPTGVGPAFGHSIVRPMEVKFHSNSGDDEVYEISTGACIVSHHPARNWKLTGVTA